MVAKLTREQVLFLTFIGIIGNIVYIHTWMDDSTDRSAWLAAFVGILMLTPFLIWIFYLAKSYPESTILDILENGLGRLTSILICSIFIIINVALAVTHLNMFTEMLNVFFLPNTPPLVIMASMVFIGALLAGGRIRSFARLVEILAVVGALNYFIAFLLAIFKNFHIEYIIPIFDTSLLGFVKGTLFMASGSADCLLLFMILVRFVPHPAKHYMWVVKGVVMSSLIFTFAIFIIIAMMSPELAKRIAFGGVNAAKLIKIGNFIQGMEAFIFITYQFIAIGKITTCLYCAWTASKKIFCNKKPLLHMVIMSLLILIPSVWLSSYNKAYFLAVFFANYIILPFSILVLLLASLSVMIKNKKTGSDRK